MFNEPKLISYSLFQLVFYSLLCYFILPHFLSSLFSVLKQSDFVCLLSILCIYIIYIMYIKWLWIWALISLVIKSSVIVVTVCKVLSRVMQYWLSITRKRSKLSLTMAILKPIPRWPSKFASGIRQSSRIRFAVDDARIPSLSSFFPSDRPGWGIGTRKALIPWEFTA